MLLTVKHTLGILFHRDMFVVNTVQAILKKSVGTTNYILRCMKLRVSYDWCVFAHRVSCQVAGERVENKLTASVVTIVLTIQCSFADCTVTMKFCLLCSSFSFSKPYE
jgi:hypothetical protein